MNDADLVRRFQRGDEAAFDLLVDRHRTRIYSLVARLASRSEADDLTQEVFIGAYRALPAFRNDSSFITWLYRIGMNICARQLRRRRLRTQELGDWEGDPDERADPARHSEQEELRREVHRAIDSLPHKLRLVVVLRDMHGLSYEEIAAVVGCPVGTVRSRLHYATQRLSERLRDYVEID